jgi:DNA-directed RNA polymerase subunit K/omega
MFNPAIPVTNESENSYMLASIIGKRAIQIIGGSNVMTECKSKNAITIAISEYKEKKISYTKDSKYFDAIK